MTREEANITIDYLKEMQEGYIEGEGYERHPLPEWYALDKAIKVLEQESILDKIRAEIEQKARPNEIGGRGNGKSIRYGLCMALQIIDKYRGKQK